MTTIAAERTSSRRINPVSSLERSTRYPPPNLTGHAKRREVQRHAVACSRDRRRRALDRRRAAPAHPGGLAAAGDDPDRLRYADAALLVVLLHRRRANSSWDPRPGSMSTVGGVQSGW